VQYRQDLYWQARELMCALGEAPAQVSRVEADLRMFAHDILHPHHEKDFHTLAAFPPARKRVVDLIIFKSSRFRRRGR
jgi:hypothetical protein